MNLKIYPRKDTKEHEGQDKEKKHKVKEGKEI